MTIDEILKCDIPEGTHKLAMEKICQDIEHFTSSSFYTKDENKPLVISLCAAFKALYDLANGTRCQNCIKENIDHESEKKEMAFQAWKASRENAIRDVLAVVDEVMNERLTIAKAMKMTPRDYTDEITKRIKALQEGK